MQILPMPAPARSQTARRVLARRQHLVTLTFVRARLRPPLVFAAAVLAGLFSSFAQASPPDSCESFNDEVNAYDCSGAKHVVSSVTIEQGDRGALALPDSDWYRWKGSLVKLTAPISSPTTFEVREVNVDSLILKGTQYENVVGVQVVPVSSEAGGTYHPTYDGRAIELSFGMRVCERIVSIDSLGNRTRREVAYHKTGTSVLINSPDIYHCIDPFLVIKESDYISTVNSIQEAQKTTQDTQAKIQANEDALKIAVERILELPSLVFQLRMAVMLATLATILFVLSAFANVYLYRRSLKVADGNSDQDQEDQTPSPLELRRISSEAASAATLADVSIREWDTREPEIEN